MDSSLDASNDNIKGISPYLYYADLGAALTWLGETFGFTEDVRFVDADGGVQEAEMLAGETRIHMGGCAPGPNDGPGQLLIVNVNNVDAIYSQMVEAGVDAEPPEDKPYGPRVCETVDPWGYKWAFWQWSSRPVEMPEGWSMISTTSGSSDNASR